MATMKGCTYCGKSMPMGDVMCPHCGQGNRDSATHYCTQCGAIGFAAHYSGGSFIIAGLLLVVSIAFPILFLALIAYVLWWAFSSYTGCPRCRAKTIIPVDSPIAQAALAPKADTKG